MKRIISLLIFCFVFISGVNIFAQVSYGAAASYGLRKVKPGYTGSSIQVRRSCDNAVKDIGFTSCGDLDTTSLKTFVVAANPLSSISVAAAAAFSLRRLSCAYAGSAICVRRSSDNATVNVGFTSWGDLDTAAMKIFVGANSAFVTTWYDQSGNGRNASQATNANQPRIMLAGVIERQNGQPAIKWLGMGYSLVTAGFTAYGTAACFNGVAKVNTNVTYNAIVNKCTNNYPAPLDFYNANMLTGNGVSASFFGYGTTFNAATPLGIWTYQGIASGTANGYYNGTLSASGAVGTYADNGNPLFLGSRFDGVTGLDGWISEVITFGTLPSATERNFIEWTQSAYYGINGPALTPIPAGAPSGYISIWYDQTGSGFPVTQATLANQPRIINAGVIEKSGTKSAIKFNGFPFNLACNVPVSAYPLSISTLANTAGASTFGAFVKHGGIDGVNNASAGIGVGIGATGSNFDNTGTSLIELKEWIVWCPSSPGVNYPATPFALTSVQQSGGTLNAYLNGTGVPLTSSATAVGASITGSLYVGGYSNVTNRFPVVKESEVHIFGSALNTTRRTLLETNQASHYNITIANSKYTPPGVSSYNLYVNGVGRESVTDSVAGTRASVGLGFSIGTTASDFLKDNGDYLTVGIDCPILATTSTLNLVAPVVTRWYNDWYLNKTDVSSNNGNINFYFSFSDYGAGVAPGVAANYRLLNRVNTGANFAVVPNVTTTVSGNRVYFLVDASNIPTNYYYTIGTTNDMASPLPVELADFTAQKEGKEVNVLWSTMSERNTDNFVVQRSINAVNFSDIGNVKARGTANTEKTYSLIDEKPLPGLSYYRLKQIDFDKSVTYSKTVPIYFDIDKTPLIYPNPTSGNLKINNCNPFDKIMVMDALGRLVFNTAVNQENMNVDLSALQAGEYFLIMYNLADQNKFTSKLIIEKGNK